MSGELKKCNFCGEDILAVAIKCKHCGSELNKTTMESSKNIKNMEGYSFVRLMYRLYFFALFMFTCSIFFSKLNYPQYGLVLNFILLGMLYFKTNSFEDVVINSHIDWIFKKGLKWTRWFIITFVSMFSLIAFAKGSESTMMKTLEILISGVFFVTLVLFFRALLVGHSLFKDGRRVFLYSIIDEEYYDYESRIKEMNSNFKGTEKEKWLNNINFKDLNFIKLNVDIKDSELIMSSKDIILSISADLKRAFESKGWTYKQDVEIDSSISVMVSNPKGVICLGIAAIDDDKKFELDFSGDTSLFLPTPAQNKALEDFASILFEVLCSNQKYKDIAWD